MPCPYRAGTGFMYSASPMLDLGYVRDHLDVIEKMAGDRGISLDLAPFREIDTERRQLIRSTELLKAERNKASDIIARVKKAGGGALATGPGSTSEIRNLEDLFGRMKEVSERVKQN